jgi:hypothetical protein
MGHFLHAMTGQYWMQINTLMNPLEALFVDSRFMTCFNREIRLVSRACRDAGQRKITFYGNIKNPIQHHFNY